MKLFIILLILQTLIANNTFDINISNTEINNSKENLDNTINYDYLNYKQKNNNISIPQKRLYGDIDGDGKNEIVAWRQFASNELGDFYQLLIFDENKKLLWEGPKITNPDNRYIFFSLDFGESFPEAIIDIDKDNRAEILAPSPQCDVSPLYYRILKWKNNKLIDTKPKVLVINPHAREQLLWENPIPNSNNVAWVSKFIDANKDSAIVEISQNLTGSDINLAKAKIQFTYYGAYVTNWIKPLSNNYLYYADISLKDHFNSKGIRLTTIREILRQDRANLYRGDGDAEDTKANFFNSIKKRELFYIMEIIPRNSSLEYLKRVIVNKNPLLKVEIKDNKLLITIIKE